MYHEDQSQFPDLTDPKNAHLVDQRVMAARQQADTGSPAARLRASLARISSQLDTVEANMNRITQRMERNRKQMEQQARQLHGLHQSLAGFTRRDPFADFLLPPSAAGGSGGDDDGSTGNGMTLNIDPDAFN